MVVEAGVEGMKPEDEEELGSGLVTKPPPVSAVMVKLNVRRRLVMAISDQQLKLS